MPAAAQASPQQQDNAPSEAQLIAAVIAATASAVTAAAIVRALGSLFKAAGIGTAALSAVAHLLMSWPADPMEGTGPATAWAIRTNALRRAQFFLAACRRVQASVTAARSANEPLKDAILSALTAEKRYMAQMIAMAHQRVKATSAVDGMADTYGDLLGWQATLDERCSPGCAKASGSNFRVSRPPVIEGAPAFPGTVHPSCRCMPVRPFRDAPVLP